MGQEEEEEALERRDRTMGVPKPPQVCLTPQFTGENFSSTCRLAPDFLSHCTCVRLSHRAPPSSTSCP